MAVLLGLDLGTSKLCALAVSAETRRTLAVRSAPNDADVPGLPPDRHEQDPLKILDRSLELVRELTADRAVAPEELVGVCVTGQMHGVMLASRDLRPVTSLITWRDRRVTKPDVSASSRTGCRLHPGYGGLTLHWLSKKDSIPDGTLALSLADYVTAALTGVVATEPTHAASWGILDVRKLRWDRAIVRRLGIPEAVLPEVRPSARPVGRLLPRLAGQLASGSAGARLSAGGHATTLGLPETVRVCSPVGDNQASVIGAAGSAKDTCILNLGTGGQASVRSPEFRFVPALETRPMPFGGYVLVGASLCGGWSYSYLRRFYQDVAREMAGLEVTDEEAYARLNALAARAPPGAGGLTADTRFSGSRSDPEIRGAVTGIDTGNLTPGHLARALVEGMVRELAELAGLFPGIQSGAGGAGRKVPGIHIDRIVASGGAVRKNPLVREVIEHEFGAPCSVGPAREEAALGAAYCAGVGLGLFSPEEVNAAAEGA